MLISADLFFSWQKSLASRKFFRWFWKFWAIYSVGLVFAAGGYLLIFGYWREVALAVAAFVAARIIVSPLLYLVVKKGRPYQILKFIPPHSWFFSRTTHKKNSFPSDHAVSFASIATVFFCYFPALGIFLFVAMLLNGMGRIVLGYHYISHVLAGWLLGITCGLGAVYYLAPLLFTR